MLAFACPVPRPFRAKEFAFKRELKSTDHLRSTAVEVWRLMEESDIIAQCPTSHTFVEELYLASDPV